MTENKIVPHALPENLPAGAKAFQAAVDDKLTKDVWEQILIAQIDKAKSGDRGAAKFLLEYAGGVASMRGATFVQENHHHDHYHDGDVTAPRLTDPAAPAAAVRNEVRGAHDVPDRTPKDYSDDRERRARRAVNGVNVRS